MNIKQLNRILHLFLSKLSLFSLLSFSLLLLSLLGLSSCLESQQRGPRSAISSYNANGTPTSSYYSDYNATPTASTDDLYWFTHLKVGPSLALNYNINTQVYLKGTFLNDYLNISTNFQNEYCLVSTFKPLLSSNSGSLKQLRARMVPISIPNVATLSKERGFSVDFANELINSNSCAGTIDGITTSSANAVYSIAKVCTNCTQSIRSEAKSIKLYSASDNSISDSSILYTIDSSVLSLQININSDITDPTGNCTLKECTLKGFDCCLNGQCVNDGMVRPDSTAHSNYSQASMDVSSDPNNFILWPEIYYVCPGKILPTPLPTATSNPLEEAEVRLNYLKELYYCLSYGKSKNYNYCQSTFDLSSYTQAKNYLWTICGCGAVGTPAPADPASACREYGINIFDINKNLITVTPAAPATLYGQVLTIDTRSSTTTPYLRGQRVNSFLANTSSGSSNMKKKYCIVFNYNVADAGVLYKQLRVSADPIVLNNYLTKQPEKMLRINLYEYLKNQNYCRGTINDENNTPVPNTTLSFKDNYLVTNTCNSICLSTSTNIYASTTSAGISNSSIIDTSNLDVTALQLRITQDTTDITTTAGDTYWFLRKSDEIQNVSCKYYGDEVPTPFQNLSVSVNSRMAPHRFFKNSDGKAVDNMNTLFGTPDSDEVNTPSYVEGVPFKYDDPVNLSGPPSSQAFNMNSILGQFKLDQSGALPALTINVEIGNTYVIGAVSGNYSPCPSCAKDNWYNGFSAFPSSQYGTGLQAVSYSTYRDSNNNNYTGGNYEDTIWGRACWVPPTMIPYSHYRYSSVQEQRLNRLSTQAAFYMNGYQRDWYGFNKGALIGSFNGVNWFAIGKGRTITATSNKLFLAINSPFADLASRSEIVVQITSDCSGEYCATIYDYDPGVASLISPLQNEAANCQRFHYCENDTDCITALGWEYTCANITNLRTYWPSFDKNANEILDTANTLQAKIFSKTVITGNLPSAGETNRKRCVYRGSGALCVERYGNLSNFQERKLFTCAPNFYCESVGGNNFNNTINREPKKIGNFLYGRGATVLGRPPKYVGANKSFPSDTIGKNIIANAHIQYPAPITTTNIPGSLPTRPGLCRPGKSLTLIGSGNQSIAHSVNDSQNRTDYISQVGSCDSSITTGANVDLKRMHNCPLLNDNPNDVQNTSDLFSSKNTVYGDYISVETPTYPVNPLTSFTNKLIAQNSCGRESLYGGNSLFATKEAAALTSISSISEPILVRDACLRRAGSPCHSELDCSPNKLHAEVAKGKMEKEFGDTEAEKKYWEEYLICAQSSDVPIYNSQNQSEKDAYLYFDISKNRCCRASGGELTMYTMGHYNPNDTIDTKNLTKKLNTDSSNFAVRNPAASGRYSRYTILETYKNITETTIGGTPIAGTPYPMQPKIEYTAAVDSPGARPGSKKPREYQWKTIHDTGMKTCCSGWIRMFADGTHEWPQNNRLKLNPANFQCLNFRSPLVFGKSYLPNVAAEVNNVSYEQEANKFCQDPTNFGCAHYMMGNPDGTGDKKGFGISKSTPIPPSIIKATPVNDPRLIPAGSPDLNDFYIRIHSIKRQGYLHDLAPYLPALIQNSTLINYSSQGTGVYPYDTTAPITSCGLLNYTMFKDASNQTNAYFLGIFQTQMVVQIPAYINGGVNIRNIYFSRSSKDKTDNNDYEWEKVENATGPIQTLPGSGRICQQAGLTEHNYTNFADSCNENTTNNPGFNAQGWCYEKNTGWLFVRRHRCHADYAGGTTCAARNLYYLTSTTDKNGTPFSGNTGVIIEFYPLGSKRHCYRNCYKADGTEVVDADGVPSGWQTPGNTLSTLSPGNDLYYLEKLARLELLGIPQIYYEPIYCNSNAKKLVPGIFKLRTPTVLEDNYDYRTPESDNRTPFAADSIDFGTPYYTLSTPDYSNPTMKVVFQDSVAHDSIFSANKFTCCQRLGSSTANPSTCCSGYYVLDQSNNNKFICSLPRKTDLHVYFNRFVSGEGSYEEIDKSIRLIDSDFDPMTGYPRMSDDVTKKIVALGKLYCDDKQVFIGAAFGTFGYRPIPAFAWAVDNGQELVLPYGIVYQVSDADAQNNQGAQQGQGQQTSNPDFVGGITGHTRFTDGRRWNNHIYCGSMP
ncbi:MAG: hypothetical protein HQK49_15885 [Oligoflexia bacterium]|nr:hypothetical protein [Oligoflexia bacterium]